MIEVQQTLDFSVKAGCDLRDAGIETAAAHADAVSPEWRDRAFLIFKEYALSHDRFMTEDVRAFAKGMIDDPPDMRAWGAVAVKAVKFGLIVRDGYAPQRDPKSHRCPGNVWRRKAP